MVKYEYLAKYLVRYTDKGLFGEQLFTQEYKVTAENFEEALKKASEIENKKEQVQTYLEDIFNGPLPSIESITLYEFSEIGKRIPSEVGHIDDLV